MTTETTNIERIQAPGATLAHEAENAANVIRKNRTSEPGAIDEARSLEDLLFLIGEFLCALRIVRRDILWVLPGATLINLEKFVCDVLEVTINDGGSVVWKTKNVRCDCG
jgi:hypothetical protein